MIIGVGVDVVDLARFEASLKRTPALLHRLFTESERQLPVVSLAGRFAAKEAIAKALGSPGNLSWLDVNVIRSQGGRPVVETSGEVAHLATKLGVSEFQLSISHDGPVAVAFVVAVGGAGK